MAGVSADYVMQRLRRQRAMEICEPRGGGARVEIGPGPGKLRPVTVLVSALQLQRAERYPVRTAPEGASYSDTGRPGLVIVPGAQYHVMISTVSRPASTAGSASASRLASPSEPVR